MVISVLVVQDDPSNGKNHITTVDTLISFVSLNPSKVHKAPVNGCKPLLVSSWYSSSPLFAITPAVSALIAFRSSRVGYAAVGSDQ